MSDKSQIEWCDATWNPLRGTLGRHYCVKISPGCEHCYASSMNRRLSKIEYPHAADVVVINGQIVPKAAAGPPADRLRLDERALLLPLGWKEPRRIFVGSMTDVAGEWVPDAWLDAIFGVMAIADQHIYQVLTKRPRRLKAWFDRWLDQRQATPILPGLPDPVATWIGYMHDGSQLDWPLPNVWLGVSVESDAFTWRAKVLSEIPAAVRFVSAEPLLGPLPSLELKCPDCEGRGVDPAICTDAGCDHSPEDWCGRCNGKGWLIDWLIVGGESAGPAERRLVEPCCRKGSPFPPPTYAPCPIQRSGNCELFDWRPKPEALEWVRDLRDRASAAGVAFFLKQWGGPNHASGGRMLDGRTWDEFARPRELVTAGGGQ